MLKGFSKPLRITKQALRGSLCHGHIVGDAFKAVWRFGRSNKLHKVLVLGSSYVTGVSLAIFLLVRHPLPKFTPPRPPPSPHEALNWIPALCEHLGSKVLLHLASPWLCCGPYCQRACLSAVVGSLPEGRLALRCIVYGMRCFRYAIEKMKIIVKK